MNWRTFSYRVTSPPFEWGTITTFARRGPGVKSRALSLRRCGYSFPIGPPAYIGSSSPWGSDNDFLATSNFSGPGEIYRTLIQRLARLKLFYVKLRRWFIVQSRARRLSGYWAREEMWLPQRSPDVPEHQLTVFISPISLNGWRPRVWLAFRSCRRWSKPSRIRVP